MTDLSERYGHEIPHKEKIKYSQTIIILGAGASIDGGVPDFAKLWSGMDMQFGITAKSFSTSCGMEPSQWAMLIRAYTKFSNLNNTDQQNIEKFFKFIKDYQNK